MSISVLRAIVLVFVSLFSSQAFAFLTMEVEQGLSDQAQSKTFEQFHNGRMSPAKILQRRLERLTLGVDGLGEFCGELMKLTDRELAYFDPEYTENEFKELLDPCLEAIELRLNLYWEGRGVDFQASLYQSLESTPTEQGTFEDAAPVGIPAGTYLTDAGLKRKHRIVLTFDDGPHPTRTRRVLDILDRFNAKAHFFQVGSKALEYPHLSREVSGRGHLMGSHSHSHRQLPRLAARSKPLAINEIVQGHNEVMCSAGLAMPSSCENLQRNRILEDGMPGFFRFPFGASTSELRDFLRSNEMTGFFWNMDTEDWKISDPKELYANVLKGINSQRGGIILFHDIHAQTVVVLPAVLDYLHRNGYELAYIVDEPARN